jgi:Ca2+-binding EF-hand superfamily protein
MKLSPDSLELIKRLIKTMIKVNGSHEYLKARLRINLEKQYLTLSDAFKSLDQTEKGYLSTYDIQDLLLDFRRNCPREDFIQEVELLLDLFDRKNAPGSQYRGISQWSFIEGLTP